MTAYSPREMQRHLSTISSLSSWTEQTLSGMGLNIGPSVSNTFVVETEGDGDRVPLQSHHVQEQRGVADEDALDTYQVLQTTDETQHQSYEADTSPSSQSPTAIKRMNLARIWWLEAVSCFLVVGMIAAIIGTVYPYQDRPLPHWPYDISINTAIAFYAEVMRAAMILVLGECLSQLKWSWFTQPRPLDHIEHYDNASRGPWGSLGLLWVIRLRALLPTIGAILMILTLLLVPFTQQIIRVYSCSVLDPALNASIPKTNFASAGSSLHIGAGLNSISPDVQAVMNSGIYDSDLKQVSFNCPTGNCTFNGEYHSMGWCSRCDDISDQVQIHSELGLYYNLTLPSSGLTATLTYASFVMGPYQDRYQAVVGWDNSSDTRIADTPWHRRGYGAAECSVGPCIRSYTSNVKGGNLTETLMSTFRDWDESEYWINAIDTSCLNGAEKQDLHKAGYEFNPDKTKWLPYNLSALAADAFNPTVLNDTNTTIRPECIYQTYRGQIFSLTSYLQDVFYDRVGFGPGALDGPAILQTIFREGNITFSTIDDTFNRLTQALTVWGREGDGNFMGQVYDNATCVSAQWAWLAYPASLVVCMVVFFIWTVDHARRREGSRQDYKSSPLALLFHRLGEVGSEGPTSNIQDKSELQKKAKTMKVAFQNENNVWRFMEADQWNTQKGTK
ncbi:hypothetical protein M426DRAFT_28217 [Hypoxylon sp. CI-4A]|nr:hypothetical protein M426DRAFT_28217 [Hypoxylon sp. CI-4A]